MQYNLVLREFLILSDRIVPPLFCFSVLFTFYIQDVLKFKSKTPVPKVKGLRSVGNGLKTVMVKHIIE
jgi:hypothetical protein